MAQLCMRYVLDDPDCPKQKIEMDNASVGTHIIRLHTRTERNEIRNEHSVVLYFFLSSLGLASCVYYYTCCVLFGSLSYCLLIVVCCCCCCLLMPLLFIHPKKIQEKKYSSRISGTTVGRRVQDADDYTWLSYDDFSGFFFFYFVAAVATFFNFVQILLLLLLNVWNAIVEMARAPNSRLGLRNTSQSTRVHGVLGIFLFFVFVC